MGSSPISGSERPVRAIQAGHFLLFNCPFAMNGFLFNVDIQELLQFESGMNVPVQGNESSGM
jgi:hypothetical protein